MSIYGHFNGQYYGNKINFPEESFLIAGISYYQQNLTDIDFDSEIIMKLEPENKYDRSTPMPICDGSSKEGRGLCPSANQATNQVT